MAGKSSKGSSYKIPPKEMIVTRNKSARMRQQMLEDNRKTKPKPGSSKSLLKKVLKNTTQTKNKKKIVKITEDINDYYPNLKKRDVVKQMFLKPKDKFKFIGDVKSVNKRKLCIPQKFHTSNECVNRMSSACTSRKVSVRKTEPENEKKTQQPVYSELSMDEVFRFTEDTQSLTEEDFMEILTCPSPVWWEDPPDDTYIEGAIFSRTPPPKPAITKNNNNTKPKEVNNSTAVEITKKPTKNDNKTPLKIINALKKSKVAKSKKLDEQFLKKNTKLENILGCVKDRLSSSRSKFNLSRRLKEQEVPSGCVPEDRICDDHETDANKLKLTRKNVNMYDKSSVTCNNSTESILISTDTDELSDTSLNDIELLKHLENIDIPTKEDDLVAKTELTTDNLRITDSEIPNVDIETLIKSSVVKKTSTTDNKEIINYSGIDKESESFQQHNVIETEVENPVPNENLNNCKNSANTIDATVNEDAISKNVSTEKEGTHKKKSKRKRKMKLNRTTHSFTVNPPDGKTSNVKKDRIDSVNKYPLIFKPFSDVNKKQKNDTQISNCHRNIKTYKSGKSGNPKSSSNQKKPVNEVPKKIDKTETKKEEIDLELKDIQTPHHDRVAKESETKQKGDNESENTNKQQEINSFFKKCKNAHKTKGKSNDESDENPDYCRSCEPLPMKMIIVSHKESVKYCMKCSSVFDKDECYCIKKAGVLPEIIKKQIIQEHVVEETEFLAQNSIV